MNKKRSSALKAKTPKWARLDENIEQKEKDRESDEEENDDTFLALRQMTRSTGKYIVPRVLSKVDSTAKPLKDITMGHLKGSVNCVKFHPSKSVLVTGTEYGVVSLFQICEDNNTKLCVKKSEHFLQNTKFKMTKINSMFFYNGGLSLFVVPSNQRHCYSYDLLEGKVSQLSMPSSLYATHLKVGRSILSNDGSYVAYIIGLADVYVFELNTMDHLHTFRADARIVDFCFSHSNRNIIYAISEPGTVFMWDLAQKLEQLRFLDAGCVQSTCFTFSPNEQFIACGSNVGVVNVYEASKAWQLSGNSNKINEVKPLYTLGNLTTSVSFLNFNHDSQLLSLGSDIKSMSIRLMNCQSGSIYQNFPSRQEIFLREKLKCSAFSPNSAFLAYGTERGKCLLYRLNHFGKY